MYQEKEKDMETKNLEWFLRRNFGLKGDYYTDEYKQFIANGGTAEEFVDKWFDDDYCVHMYTKEALDAWDRANNMVDDLVEMNLISDDGMDGPANVIHDGFVDLA